MAKPPFRDAIMAGRNVLQGLDHEVGLAAVPKKDYTLKELINCQQDYHKSVGLRGQQLW